MESSLVVEKFWRTLWIHLIQPKVHQHKKKFEILPFYPGYDRMVKKPSHATVTLKSIPVLGVRWGRAFCAATRLRSRSARTWCRTRWSGCTAWCGTRERSTWTRPTSTWSGRTSRPPYAPSDRTTSAPSTPRHIRYGFSQLLWLVDGFSQLLWLVDWMPLTSQQLL